MLQFLGEWAQGHRFWVLAAVQEQIEHTGDLEYAMYRKIKDRYPLRFLLTPAHVVDLLSDSILIKKEGYEESVELVLSELQEAFPQFVTNLDEFRSIYPIHPATLHLLEEVRDCFSQTRGIVDFAVGQLAGNDQRQIPALLDQPSNRLLTPDSIIDHFHDLFEIQPEFLPLSQQLLPYYRQHLGEMFDTDKQLELAWRTIKLLMLTHISPMRTGLTPDEAASWLLHRAARIDPQKNVAIVRRILDALVGEGRYVELRNGRYGLDLEDDGGTALERFLEREKSELTERGEVIFEGLVPLLAEDDFYPSSLDRDRWQQRQVRWHFHERAYAVYFGDEEPPPHDGLAICVRPPWGPRTVVAGVRTIQPVALDAREEAIELAALARARERNWSGPAATRLESRFADRLNFFRIQLRNAYRDATFFAADGTAEPVPRLDRGDSFSHWLDTAAVLGLRRSFPSFERFAPIHGPLPNDAYRSLMRFVLSTELGHYDADDAVKLIREAYLVPMGLLKRRGRDYVVPGNLEKNELVSLVLPLIESETSPNVICEHLQGPVYGLVHDQVCLLLVMLLVQGEIDILKGKTSYREAYETMPNPLQYDRVVPGRALPVEQSRELQLLCEKLRIRLPQQLTVIAQRRAAREIRTRLREELDPLRKLKVKLASIDGGQKLADRLSQFILRLGALEAADDEIQGFQQFLYEFGTSSRALADLVEYRELSERIDQVLDELGRFQHLFSHPVIRGWTDPELVVQVESLGTVPGLEQTEALESWLRQARQAYTGYREAYREEHEKWWRGLASHLIWTWRPHALAASRHLGLEDDMQALEACRQRAGKLRCSGLVNLDFQPCCHCGFDGQASPVVAETVQFETLREKIEQSLGHFFSQEKVRARLRDWVDEGFEVTPATLAYLEKREPLPEVSDLTLFDRHLAGIELVKPVDATEMIDILAERIWQPRQLAGALGAYLDRFGDARLRFSVPRHRGAELAAWCVEQSLRHGAPLPKELARDALADVAEVFQVDWVGQPAWESLDKLELGAEIEDRVISAIISGELAVPNGAVTSFCSSVNCALEILRPSSVASVGDLASASERLYREHARFMRLGRTAWLERLETLAHTAPDETVPPLMQQLAQHETDQWVVIDALGLPLVSLLVDSLGELLPAWRLDSLHYASVSETTTTDEWYRGLVDGGVRRALEKVNVVDTLLHQRFVPFDDLCQVASAELAVACRKLWPRLEPDRPLLVFADHGFRIAPQGNAYVHGGDSPLERIVPLFHLQPI